MGPSQFCPVKKAERQELRFTPLMAWLPSSRVVSGLVDRSLDDIFLKIRIGQDREPQATGTPVTPAMSSRTENFRELRELREREKEKNSETVESRK